MIFEESLIIFLIVVLLNIIISYVYPIIHSCLPENIKNMFSSYQKVILSNRKNLLASSVNIIILVVLTIVLIPYIKKLLKINEKPEPSIFNLYNLI